MLRLQQELRDVCERLNAAAEGGGPVPPPFCAFNGGNDVWADIGNKRVGVTGSSRLRVWVRARARLRVKVKVMVRARR